MRRSPVSGAPAPRFHPEPDPDRGELHPMREGITLDPAIVQPLVDRALHLGALRPEDAVLVGPRLCSVHTVMNLVKEDLGLRPHEVCPWPVREAVREALYHLANIGHAKLLPNAYRPGTIWDDGHYYEARCERLDRAEAEQLVADALALRWSEEGGAAIGSASGWALEVHLARYWQKPECREAWPGPEVLDRISTEAAKDDPRVYPVRLRADREPLRAIMWNVSLLEEIERISLAIDQEIGAIAKRACPDLKKEPRRPSLALAIGPGRGAG